MSRMGQYFLEQIELGNFTIDRRDKYYVEIQDRKRCTNPKQGSEQDRDDPIQRNGRGKQHKV